MFEKEDKPQRKPRDNESAASIARSSREFVLQRIARVPEKIPTASDFPQQLGQYISALQLHIKAQEAALQDIKKAFAK
jgi:hypothetical protein